MSLDTDKRDQFGMPVLNIHMRFGDEVAETIHASHARLAAILEQAGLGQSWSVPSTTS